MKDTQGNKITEEEFTKDIGHRVEGAEDIYPVCGDHFFIEKDAENCNHDSRIINLNDYY